MCRAEEAIVAHLDKALGQDVLKETMDEFLGGQRAEPGLTRVGCVAEGDLVILHVHDAAIAEGDAKDVGREILEGDAAIADGLAMHHPVLLPHFRRNVCKAIRLAQGIAELGTKKFGERFARIRHVLCIACCVTTWYVYAARIITGAFTKGELTRLMARANDPIRHSTLGPVFFLRINVSEETVFCPSYVFTNSGRGGVALHIQGDASALGVTVAGRYARGRVRRVAFQQDALTRTGARFWK